MSVDKRKGSPFYRYDFVYRGRRFTGSTKETTRRAAERIEQQAREAAKAEVDRPPKAVYTLSEACGVYWLEKGCRARGQWQLDIERYLKQICALIDETLSIGEIGDKHVNQFVQARMKSIGEGRGHVAINRALSVFRSVHNHVKDLHEQPMKPIKWARHFLDEPEGRVRWLTQEEFTRLLQHLPEHARASVHWSVLTGMRLAATYELTWNRIEFGKAECSIVKKGGKSQIIVLTADAMTLLAGLPRHGPFVFDRRNRRRIFEKALKDAGIEDFRWHDLRHTHATWLRQAGVALEIVQRSLGHQSLAMTQRYAHVADHELREGLQRLPSISHANPESARIIPLKRKENE